jgi:uncharacterized delta-60 repeat protein
MKRLGKPDTGNPFVRFDEGRRGSAALTSAVSLIRPFRFAYSNSGKDGSQTGFPNKPGFATFTLILAVPLIMKNAARTRITARFIKTGLGLAAAVSLSANVAAQGAAGGSGPGALDLTFDPTAGGARVGLTGGSPIVHAALPQPDGRVLIGGWFNGVNGALRNNLARLNADGSVDPGFQPGLGADGTVLRLALQADGRVILVGDFRTVNARPRPLIARLNSDGSVDDSFHCRLAGDVNLRLSAVAVSSNGKVWIGGRFTHVNGVARVNLARLNADGSLDAGFDPQSIIPGASQWVEALHRQPDGKLLVAGSWTGSPLSLIRLDAEGMWDAGFAGVSAGDIRDLACNSAGMIAMAGGFASVNGVRRREVARLNSDGTLDSGFDPGDGPDYNFLRAVAIQPDGKVIIGGNFHAVNGVAREGLARLNADGSVDMDFDPGNAAGVPMGYHASIYDLALHTHEGVLVAAAAWWQQDTTNGLFRLDASGRSEPGFSPRLQAPPEWVSPLALQPDGKVLMGVAGSYTRTDLARLHPNGLRDESFVPGTNFAGLPALALQPDGAILIAGVTVFEGSVVVRLLSDGRVDTSFHAPPMTGGEAPIETLALQPDGKILVGGVLWLAGEHPRQGIVRLHSDGRFDTNFHPAPISVTDDPGYGVEHIFVLPGGKILIAGGFRWETGEEAGVAQLEADGTVDETFRAGAATPIAYVYAAARQTDGKVILGGYFPGSGLGAIRINPDGTDDPTFQQTFTGDVFALALQADGRILAATGRFPEGPGIVRLNADGSLDPAFQTTLSPWGADRLLLQPDGRLLAAGGFHSVNGIPVHGIARLRTEAPTDPDLAEAVDAPHLNWTTSGDALWFQQVDVTHDGIDAAQAGTLPRADGESRLSTVVTGPGVVRFWSRVQATEPGYGLKFFIGSTLQLDRTGVVDWEERVFYVPPGEQALAWSFYVDDNGPYDEQTAWLDQVRFVPGETLPVLAQHPSSRSAPEWSTVRFSVQAAGTPLLSYQWHFNEAALPGANNPVLELPYLQLTDSGAYRCVIANALGAATSAVSVLTVRPSVVVAWGDNENGQSDVPLDLTNIVAVADGDRHSLALRDDGTVVAWGDNEYGQTAVPELIGIVAIAAGGFHNLALTHNGRVIGWGANWDGQATVPSHVTNIVAIAGGSRHSLAIRADGTVAAWGNNWHGETDVPLGLSNVVSVAGGGFHSLALRSDGTVVAWGASGSGGVNRGQAAVPNGLSNVVAIAAGQLFSVALKNDGRVVSWGASQNVPPDLRNVVGIAAGAAHVLARTTDGRVVAWGSIGSATTVPPRLANVAEVAAGGSHSLALLGAPASTARPVLVRYWSGACDLSVLTRRGQAYFLEGQDTLTESPWRLLHGIAGDGAVRTLTDPAATASQRFYRVRDSR